MCTRTFIQPFFDARTATYSYVVSDTATRNAVVIDPVLDFDLRTGRVWSASVDRIVAHVRDHGLTVVWILETHVHADHISGAYLLRERTRARIAIGCGLRDVRRRFAALYDLDRRSAPGHTFDLLLDDGDAISLGVVDVVALAVPGHTPADLAYVADDAVFVGDALFMPDVGTSRADFPGGNATSLYRSVRKLLALPPQTRLFVGHDYPPHHRGPRCQATVAEQRAMNIHVREGTTEAAFVAMREARDASLEVPHLLLPAIQVNLDAGQLPAVERNGLAYLRIPLNGFPAKEKPD